MQAALAAGPRKRQSWNWKSQSQPPYLAGSGLSVRSSRLILQAQKKVQLGLHRTQLLHCLFEIQLGQTGHGGRAEVSFLPGAAGFKVNSCYIEESTLGNSLTSFCTVFLTLQNTNNSGYLLPSQSTPGSESSLGASVLLNSMHGHRYELHAMDKESETHKGYGTWQSLHLVLTSLLVTLTKIPLEKQLEGEKILF